MLTLGQKAMAVEPNPNVNMEYITTLKLKFAELYDEVNAISTHNKTDKSTPFVNDSKYHLEVACMLAIKSLTK